MAKVLKPKPCKRCKAEIPVERLEAVSGTQLCVKCSQALGGEYDYKVEAVNTAKSGSLKKNYGSFKVRRKRRDISRQIEEEQEE